MESRWDQLPLEIRQYIVVLWENQIAYYSVPCLKCGDVLRKGSKKLKQAWGLGRVFDTSCKKIVQRK